MNATSAEIISGILIVAGTIFCLISAFGLVRLPDVYTRAHAASKSSTLGVLGVLIGTLLYFLISDGYFSIRLILGIFFVFLTAPVSAHMVCRSAYRSGVQLADTSVEDALQGFFKKEQSVSED